jgi:uncharacterized membrane protein
MPGLLSVVGLGQFGNNRYVSLFSIHSIQNIEFFPRSQILFPLLSGCSSKSKDIPPLSFMSTNYLSLFQFIPPQNLSTQFISYLAQITNIQQTSHPVHPATVHLPLAFMLTASALDLLTYFSLRSPSLLTPLAKLATFLSSSSSSTSPTTIDALTLLSTLSLLSYASTLASLLTSLPTLSSGLAEGYAMISAQGLDLSNSKVRTMALHALLNDIAVVGAVYNAWSRRQAEGFMVTGFNVAVSAVLMGAVVMYSAYLGGTLVYKYGVGVQRQGRGKAIKEGMMKGKREGKKEL